MANCYQCGSGGASYRRTVNTGHSVGSFVSKRSYGSSTRSYYGLRSVCENCAANIDKWRNIRWAVLWAALGIFLIYTLMK